MNSDLIVFGEDWGGLPSSTQHLMKQLSLQRKVLWVNSIGLRQPRLALNDLTRVWNKFKPFKKHNNGIQQTVPTQQISVIQPRTLPAPRSLPARRLASTLLRQQLLPAIARAGLQRPILWTSLPTAVDLIGHLGEHASVYYCGDDFSALAGVDHATVTLREQELLQRADLVIGASPALCTRLASPVTRLLTHGVDFALFNQPAQRAADLPSGPRPTAGFYGSISAWLDIELLLAVIRRLPQWNFVFIGKAVVDVSVLQALPNVFMLGPRAHHQLPSYSQHWDASLLPFRRNAQILACNPLKLTEYLAAGSPIVSTSFPALQPYRELVSVADDADSMVCALEHSRQLKQMDGFAALLSRSVAAHSWQARAEQLDQWLDAL